MTVLAKFNLFRPDGLRVYFEVEEADPAAADGRIAELYAIGYTQNAGGLENDESIEDITGWVLGETSRNEPVVWLYAAPLQFKVASIWVELIPEMPFDIKGAKMWPSASAPKLDEATSKGFFNPYSFQIVKKLNGKVSESNNPLSDYARVYQPAGGGAQTVAAEVDHDTNFLDEQPQQLHTTGTFIKYCIDNIERYTDAHGVKGALKKLGYTSVNGNYEARHAQFVALQQHAAERDNESNQPEPTQGSLIESPDPVAYG